MYSSNARGNAIQAIIGYKSETHHVDPVDADPTRYFGCNVFNDAAMRQRLPDRVYQSLKKTIEHGERLDISLADEVAAAMKDWAISKGATHFTHIFYPLTGQSAEKHDSFLSIDKKGEAIAKFSGKMLIQSEPDASSFPSGGLRNTFEARGYTAWDVTSPAYVMEGPNGVFLCIPTVFLSWTGVVLDRKTPLLRSNAVIAKQAKRVLEIFGVRTSLPIVSYAGLEQEFFLVDRHFVFARPDLLVAGRTLFGARPPKGQEFEDQYFGVMPRRVLGCLMEVERELYKLGVPMKTRHNETAPSQYEVAPIFEAANLALDHNQLTMRMLRHVAKNYGLQCLLHEKPFAGINGSGKHLNYSIGNAEVGSLFTPGNSPASNALFLVFLVAFIRGLHLHGDLLRATVAAPSNDHRLGATEAPPAIMSMFLGDQLTEILELFRAGRCATSSTNQRSMNVGVETLPPLKADPGDRNRTSPFAFTGNRFEFRALGAGMAAADAQVALNLILADSLDFIATRLEKAVSEDPNALNSEVAAVIRHIMEEHSAVIFNGDGYSEVWHREAERRGLANNRTTPEALPAIMAEHNVSLLTKYNVLSRQELAARLEIYLEQYSKTIQTEAMLTLKMARTIIYPAGLRYLSELSQSAINLQTLGRKQDLGLLDRVQNILDKLAAATNALEEQLNLPKENDAQKHADRLCTAMLPAMNMVRTHADELENLVPVDKWPLPSYQEMLFIK